MAPRRKRNRLAGFLWTNEKIAYLLESWNTLMVANDARLTADRSNRKQLSAKLRRTFNARYPDCKLAGATLYKYIKVFKNDRSPPVVLLRPPVWNAETDEFLIECVARAHQDNVRAVRQGLLAGKQGRPSAFRKYLIDLFTHKYPNISVSYMFKRVTHLRQQNRIARGKQQQLPSSSVDVPVVVGVPGANDNDNNVVVVDDAVADEKALSTFHQRVTRHSEIKQEHGEMYRAECGSIIEETKDVYVNFEDYFVKDEDTWKREEVDDKEEHPMDNSATGNKSNLEIFVNTAEDDAEVIVTSDLTNKHKNVKEIKYEIKLEDEEMYRDECEPIIAETEDVYPNLVQCSIKEEDSGKREEADDKEEYPMNNDSTNNESHSKISSKSFITTFETFLKGYTDGKPYKCSRCNLSFNHQWNLETHRRTHTNPNIPKSYKCSECDKHFRDQSYLANHLRVHTGEKPYECSICNKCFRTKLNVAGHMRTHTGMKPYECSECGKCFSYKSNLESHVRIHTGQETV